MKMRKKNIDFEQHEEGNIKDLSDSVRMTDGVDVQTKGYPTLKISVKGQEHFYEGAHKAADIYTFIIDQLKGKKQNVEEMKGGLKRKNVNKNNILLEEDNETNNENTGLPFSKKVIGSTDFKVLDESDVRMSEVLGKMRLK